MTKFEGQLSGKAMVIYGSEDKMSRRDMQEWQRFFTHQIGRQEFAGDHFFIHHEENIKRVIHALLCDFGDVSNLAGRESCDVTSDCVLT